VAAAAVVPAAAIDSRLGDLYRKATKSSITGLDDRLPVRYI